MGEEGAEKPAKREDGYAKREDGYVKREEGEQREEIRERRPEKRQQKEFDPLAGVAKNTRNVKPTWSGAPAKSWKEPNAQARKVGGNRLAGATDDDEGWNMN